MSEYKVLLDLSTIMSGKFLNSGIPQETRMLFKIFSEMPEITQTGLICSHSFASLFKFKEYENNIKRTLAYSNYFLGLDNDIPKKSLSYKIFFLLYIGQKLLRKVLFENHYSTHSLDTEFNNYIWRKGFNNALDPQFREMILNQYFVISNFNKFVLRCKINARLPLPTLDTKGMDFAIFQYGLPLVPRVSPGTIPLVRFHDLIPLQFPDTVNNLNYSESHAKGLLASAKNAIFICNSQPVRDELTSLLPAIKDRTYVIPLPLLTEGSKIRKNSHAIPAIFASHRATLKVQKRNAQGKVVKTDVQTETQFDPFSNDCTNYIISVSNLEPRKNFLSLIRAWERIRYLRDNKLKLVIVGSAGSKCKPVLDAMKPHVYHGDIIHLEKVPIHELKMLYSCARAFVFPSYCEGFGSTPVEAMNEGCPTIVADIPVMRWVLGDAALYCNPYDVTSISDAIDRLLYSPEATLLTQALINKGHKRVELYSPAVIGKQWHELFHKLKADVR